MKNKSRVFHQRLKSTIESQLAIVESSDWEDILRPTATYLQTSDEAFKEVVGEVLGEAVPSQPEEEPIDVTRQFSPEEMAELQARIEAGNKELAEFEAQQANSQAESHVLDINTVVEEIQSHSVELQHEDSEMMTEYFSVSPSATGTASSTTRHEAQQESVTIL